MSPLAAARAFTKIIRPMMGTLLANAVQRCLGFEPEVLVYHPKIMSAPLVAARLGVPHLIVEIVPSVTVPFNWSQQPPLAPAESRWRAHLPTTWRDRSCPSAPGRRSRRRLLIWT